MARDYDRGVTPNDRPEGRQPAIHGRATTTALAKTTAHHHSAIPVIVAVARYRTTGRTARVAMYVSATTMPNRNSAPTVSVGAMPMARIAVSTIGLRSR